MQFKVPQFLDIEDKIFGPFTFKEFVYLVGGAGLCFVLYKLMGLLFGLIPMLAIAGLSLALVFYRPNNKPLINMIEAGFNYLLQNKLYVWERRKNKPTTKNRNEGRTEETVKNAPRLSGDKLRDLAWSLNVLDINKH